MAKQQTVQFTKGEIGESGTITTAGFIMQTEFDRDLLGIHGLHQLDVMRKKDATIRAAFSAIILPIIQASWYIEKGEDTPIAIEIAEKIEDNLMSGMTQTWVDFLTELLDYLIFGFYVFEIVYEFDPLTNFIKWRKFAPRLPWTITRWLLSNGGNGVVQMLPDGKMAEIPMEKLMIYVNEKKGDNWYGVSMFRPAYQHYRYKDGLYKIEAIAIERQGLGIPTMSYPSGATEEMKNKAEKILRNIRSHEQAHVLLTEGWTFEIANMQAGGTMKPDEAIKHHNREELLSVLAEFLELGSGGRGSTGSHALSRDQSQLFEISIRSIAEKICDIVNRYAIPKLVDLNYNDVQKYPELKFAKIGAIDMNIFSAALQRFAQAGVLHADENMEDDVRNKMDLPPVTPEDRAEEELLHFLDELEGKPPFPPPPVKGGFGGGAPAPGGGAGESSETNPSANEVKGDAPADPQARVSQPQEPTENVTDENPYQESMDTKNELLLLINEKRMELTKRKMNGKPFSPEEVQAIILELLQKKHELIKASKSAMVASTVGYQGDASRDTLKAMLGRVNNAISAIESQTE